MSPLPHGIIGGSKERRDAKITLGDGKGCLRWSPQIRRFPRIRKTCHGSLRGGGQTKGHWWWSPFISSLWVGNIANRANTFLLNLNALCLWTSSIAVPSQYEVVGGWVWGEFGDRSYILRTKKPKTFETKTFAEPRGSPVTALVLACYLLGRKRSQTSYYSNNSAPKVSTLRWRWKRFSYLKRAERKKLGFWIYLPST